MRVAYYHSGNLAQPGDGQTPIRAALAATGIDVVDTTGVATDVALQPGSVAHHCHVARQFCSGIDEGAGVDAWISEGCGAVGTDQSGPMVVEEIGVPFIIAEPDPEIVRRDDQMTALDIMKRATHVVTTSSATAHYFQNSKPRTDCLTLLPAFVDVDPFRAAYKIRELHKSRIAAKLRLPETSPWLLTDGAMITGDSMKSYDVLARALSRLALMDWRLIIVAGGNALKEGRELMLRLPQENIRFLDAMPVPDFAALCVSCDLYVWPSIGDAAPASLLEAQSSGLPVIAGRKDSTQDRVIDGRTGRLTPIGNAESFANAVSFLLRHPNFLQSFSEDAADIVNTQHDLNSAATSLGKLLSNLVQAGR